MSFIFLSDLFLEARAEILKKFRWFFGPFEINWPLTCFSFSVEFVIYEILWCSKKSPFESFFLLENSSAFSSSACFSLKPRTSILCTNVLSYNNQPVRQKFRPSINISTNHKPFLIYPVMRLLEIFALLSSPAKSSDNIWKTSNKMAFLKPRFLVCAQSYFRTSKSESQYQVQVVHLR